MRAASLKAKSGLIACFMILRGTCPNLQFLLPLAALLFALSACKGEEHDLSDPDRPAKPKIVVQSQPERPLGK